MRREVDLIVVVACSLLLGGVIFATPSAGAPRIILGLPFVLFFPGYTLVAALFPGKEDLDPIERVALSLGLSVAVVPLIGLALNFSPWGIRLTPILVALTAFIVVAAVAAFARRRMLPEQEAFGLKLDAPLSSWARAAPPDKLFGAGVIALMLGLGFIAYSAATSHGRSEAFTEFYVLGPGGKAEGYPTTMKVDDSATVILGIVNREGKETTYRISETMGGQEVGSLDTLSLTDGKRLEQVMNIAPTEVGDAEEVDFLLYRTGDTEPYRSLRLRIDVQPHEEAAPSPTATPTPATSPSPP